MSSIRRQGNRSIRKASKLIVGGFRPPIDPFVSWFGRVRVALPDETWPLQDGRPMVPICQINCTELPYRPASLDDVAFLTLFVARDGDDFVLPRDRTNGDGWLLRTYPNVAELVPIGEQTDRDFIKPFPIRWELIEEAPSTDEALAEELQNHYCSKVGGWPSPIQDEVFPGGAKDLEFVFQIDTEPKARIGWGDSGIAYFARGIGALRDQWFCACQFL